MVKLNSQKINNSLKIVKVLCGRTRFKIVYLLKENKDGLTVTQLAKILNSSLSKVSHQLKILKETKLVTSNVQKREVIYKLGNHHLRQYLSIIFK